MIVALKAQIYRQFGIYLAHKEELAYVTSHEFWQDFLKISGKDNMNPWDVQGLLIGLWQAHHGFYRTYNRKKEARKLKKRNLKRVRES